MLKLRSLLLASLVLSLPVLGFTMEGQDDFKCSSFNGLTDDPCISKTVVLALNDAQNANVDSDKRHRPGRPFFGGRSIPFGFYPYGFFPWGFYPYGGYGYPYWMLGDEAQDSELGDGGNQGNREGR